jgi:hypothetical protein
VTRAEKNALKQQCWRWVVTHVDRHGTRSLSYGAQGRWTWPSQEEAAEALEHLLAHNGEKRLAGIYGPQAVGTFQVQQVECWPGHHDPKRTVFEL